MSSLPLQPPSLPHRNGDGPLANATIPSECFDDGSGSDPPITLARTMPDISPILTTPTTTRKLQSPTSPVAAGSSFTASPLTPSSPPCLPLLPLMGVSAIDLLEADPRPSFVISLLSSRSDIACNDANVATHSPSVLDVSPTASGTSCPYVVYGNPALTSSPSLRELVTSRQMRHASIWADITAATINDYRGVLPVVYHLGVHWTRSILGGGQFVVFSADTPVAVEPVVQQELAAHSPAPTAAVASGEENTSSENPTQQTTIETTTTNVTNEPIPAFLSASTPQPSCQQPQPRTSTSPKLTDYFWYEASQSPTNEVPAAAAQPPAAASSSDTLDVTSPATAADIDEGTDGDSQHGDESRQNILQLEAITDLVPVGVLALDRDRNVSFANRAWYRIIGAPSMPKGKKIKWDELLQYMEVEDQPAVLHSLDQLCRVPSISFGFCVKRRGTGQGREKTNMAPEPSPGRSRVLATATGEKDAKGVLVRIIVCLREIVEEHLSIAAAAALYAQQASNLRRMTEYATVGLYDMDTDGRLRDANRVFIEMCGLGTAQEANLSMEIVKPWLWCVIDEDRSIVSSAINRIAAGCEYLSMEVRLSKPWITDDGAGNRIEAPRWIDATMLPIKDAEGKVISITGCASDVSLRRWQLERERQVKEEAIESRRQQENFVDVTSHEIRNPLTVIMHCADAVLESLNRISDLAAQEREPVSGSRIVAAESESVTLQKTLFEDAIDYTEIIVGSALHQKSIVDDILTMSKLDSDLLTVTAVTVDPIEIVRTTLWMFEVQARQHSISLSMILAPSYEAVGVDYFDLDPSRLKQILINLLTNALKFTCSGDVREVTVTVGASRTRPTDETCSVSFVPRTEPKSETPTADTVSVSDVSRGNSVFLIFEVKDTGEGLTKEGRDTLFQKFVQVNSTTHVKHGGSGLGLFISKRLAEIQNGAIGVASQLGIGSTFAFYIEASISPLGVVPEVLTPAEAAKKAIAVGLGTQREKSSNVGATTTLLHASPDAAVTAAAKEKGALSAVVTATPPRESVAKYLKNFGDATETASNRAALPGGIQPSVEVTQTTAAPIGIGRLAAVPTTPPEVRGVLLVEDNAVNQKVTRRYFEKGGFSVQVAANGLEAMDKIHQSDRCIPGGFPISVVLMDMEMPVQGGLECTQNIRALEAAGMFSGGRIPVVMITGNARPGQIADARAAGCDDVIVKPFQLQQLYEHIQLIIRMLWEKDRHLLLAQGDGEAPATAVEVDAGAAL